jgi:homoserine kinase
MKVSEIAKEPSRILSKEEVDLISHSAAEMGRFGLRDSTIVLLIYRHGLRPAELTELVWGDIDLVQATMKIARIKDSPNTEHILDREDFANLKRIARQFPDRRNSDFVFLTERGGKLTERGVHMIVARAGKLAGLDFPVNPNLLRRSCGFELARNSATVQDIRHTLGHKRLKNAKQYVERIFEQSVLPESIPKVRTMGRENDHTPLVESSLTLKIPASTANLGPGLDSLGLALTAYTYITFELLKKNYPDIPRISLMGEIATISQSRDQGDLIHTILKKLCGKTEMFNRLRITVDSDIPLGCGLGASGAAILGAVWANQVLKGEVPTRSNLLALATDIEGHPETMAASLSGGLTICATEKNNVFTQKVPWPDDWHILVVIPPYSLTTPVARAVLPKDVSLEDAIYNVQRVALLVGAVGQADERTMSAAMKDRLHESYRTNLVPELSQLRKALKLSPIIGCVLSGAGSSILVVVRERHKAEVSESINKWIEHSSRGCRLLSLQVDQDGMQELMFSSR